MTYMEIESMIAAEETSNDYTQGYDDGIKGYPAKENGSQQYNNGHKLGLEYKGK